MDALSLNFLLSRPVVSFLIAGIITLVYMLIREKQQFDKDLRTLDAILDAAREQIEKQKQINQQLSASVDAIAKSINQKGE